MNKKQILDGIAAVIVVGTCGAMVIVIAIGFVAEWPRSLIPAAIIVGMGIWFWAIYRLAAR